MKRFLKEILLYLAVIFFLNQGIGAYLKSYETKDLMQAKLQFSGLAWQEFYEQERTDVLVLGSSHAYRSYDPAVIEDALSNRVEVFNLGSPAQTPRTGYFALQEVLAKMTPKLILLDLYFMVCTSDEQLKNGRVVYQSLQHGRVQSAMFRGGFNFEERFLLKLFPSYVYRGRLKSKLKSSFGFSHLPAREGYYVGKGFATRDDTISLESIQNDNQFDYFSVAVSDLTSTNLAYIEKIIHLCQSNDVTIAFMSAPMPEITVNKVRNYDEFHHTIKRIAEKNEITYLDYNMDRVTAIEDAFHYYNDDHLNHAGAKLFSLQVAEDIQQHWPQAISN